MMKLLWPITSVLFGVSVGFSRDFTDGDWTYTLNKSDEATITAYGGNGGAVVIPGRIQGFPVTSVGGDWSPIFGNENKSVTSVTVPSSVTSIGKGAFAEWTGLTNVSIPNSVTSIGEAAFVGCTALISVSIPESVTSIGDAAFAGCTSLTSVTIPNSVTHIGGAAFSSCTALISVTIGSGVTNIASGAFSDCTSLAMIVIPDSVKSIGDGAFMESTSLTSITIPNSVATIGEKVFADCAGLTNLTIPRRFANQVGEMGINAEATINYIDSSGATPSDSQQALGWLFKQRYFRELASSLPDGAELFSEGAVADENVSGFYKAEIRAFIAANAAGTTHIGEFRFSPSDSIIKKKNHDTGYYTDVDDFDATKAYVPVVAPSSATTQRHDDETETMRTEYICQKCGSNRTSGPNTGHCNTGGTHDNVAYVHGGGNYTCQKCGAYRSGSPVTGACNAGGYHSNLLSP